MSTGLALAAYALLLGSVLPHVLSRSRWTHRFPVTGVAAWQALMVAFVTTAALAVYHLLRWEQHLHDGLIRLLSLCSLSGGASAATSQWSTFDTLTLAAPGVIVLLPLVLLVRTLWRLRRTQRRHADGLALVGCTATVRGATLLDHPTPAVYCLPGARSRIVVTRGAVDALSEQQLRAVLAHEEAHIRGRHHLLHACAEAFARAFPGLPLARQTCEQTALLVEMIADDAALRRHQREDLATAMCEVAAARTPEGAFGAGGSTAMVRLHRILEQPAAPPRATWASLFVSVLPLPLLPLLLSCGPAVA